MELIWTLYRVSRNLLTSSMRKRIRGLLEQHLDFLWSKKYYGQFGEDAILQTIFMLRSEYSGTSGEKFDAQHGVIPIGFYVDVGAFTPKQYSNTYWFYKRGWKGINIDATPGSMKIFDKIRKRDINIEAVVSDTVKEVTFFTWGMPTVVNTVSQEHALKWAKILGKPPKELRLRTQTLSQLLDAYLQPRRSIDFLNVDAEDHCIEVLRSNDWKKYRPTVVVVEIDETDIEKVLSNSVVKFMKDQNYSLCAWTGIGAFFVCDEKRFSITSGC